jgi:hypothetical protein
MTDEWQQEVSDRMKRLKGSLEALGIEKQLTLESRKKVEALMKEVNEFVRVVDEDKSKGAHNFGYAQGLMAKAEEKVLMIKQSVYRSLE